MKAKILKALIFFEIFCLYFEERGSKFGKIVSRLHKSVWGLVSLFMILVSVYRAVNSKHFSDFEYNVQFCVSAFCQIVGLLILLLSYKLHKRDQELLKYLTEVDELIEKSLRIKIDYGRFNREVLWKISLQIAIVIILIGFRFLNESKIYEYSRKELPMAELSVVIGRIYLMKFNFFIDLMSFQMKVGTYLLY
jgi:hypothetical protein